MTKQEIIDNFLKGIRPEYIKDPVPESGKVWTDELTPEELLVEEFLVYWGLELEDLGFTSSDLERPLSQKVLDKLHLITGMSKEFWSNI